MKDNFKLAKEVLREQGITNEIIAVNGCMYGKDANPLKNKRRIKGGGYLMKNQTKFITNMLVKIFGTLFLVTIIFIKK